MKLLFRNYVASLRERDELDAILPDLLSELGYTVWSRPQRGTAQAGVDIAATGPNEDGEQKVFLFSVKQGDLTRQSWDGTPQALRSSLGQILDDYIPHRMPAEYQGAKIVICIVIGGDVQEQVRSSIGGYFRQHSTDKISFSEWNGDKVAGLLLQGILREEIMPKEVRTHFQKAVALVDEPDIAYQHFSQLVYALSKAADDDRVRVRVARQIFIALWVLFVWARDAGNVEAPYRASELALLTIWNTLRHYVGKGSNAHGDAVAAVLDSVIKLHVNIFSELLDKKILPHVEAREAISMAVRARSHVDVNLKLFETIGRIALSGLWIIWSIQYHPDKEQHPVMLEQVRCLTEAGFKLINNNRALFLPLQDERAIEIALFLILVGRAGGNFADAHAWLWEMTDRLDLTIRTHGRYPCVFSDYRDLVEHPREASEEYRKEATSGSILIPLLAAFLSALDDVDALARLTLLKAEKLEHCTLQLWLPDASSEGEIYKGGRDHGVALCDLPLSSSGAELVKIVSDACAQSSDFADLSAIRAGCWPIVLTACRHFRLPVPPQFWIEMVSTPPEDIVTAAV